MKKVFGVILILIGSFLSFACLISTIPNLFKVISTLSLDPSSIGYLLGIIIGFVLIMSVAILIIIKGAKLAKSAIQKTTDHIEEY